MSVLLDDVWDGREQESSCLESQRGESPASGQEAGEVGQDGGGEQVEVECSVCQESVEVLYLEALGLIAVESEREQQLVLESACLQVYLRAYQSVVHLHQRSLLTPTLPQSHDVPQES